MIKGVDPLLEMSRRLSKLTVEDGLAAVCDEVRSLNKSLLEKASLNKSFDLSSEFSFGSGELPKSKRTLVS